MNINNVTEFYNLLKSKGLVSEFSNLIDCVDNYKAKCLCNNPTDKLNTYNNCVSIYTAIVNGPISNYIYKIGQSVTFYEKGRVIKSYNL